MLPPAVAWVVGLALVINGAVRASFELCAMHAGGLKPPRLSATALLEELLCILPSLKGRRRALVLRLVSSCTVTTKAAACCCPQGHGAICSCCGQPARWPWHLANSRAQLSVQTALWRYTRCITPSSRPPQNAAMLRPSAAPPSHAPPPPHDWMGSGRMSLMLPPRCPKGLAPHASALPQLQTLPCSLLHRPAASHSGGGTSLVTPAPPAPCHPAPGS